MNSMTAKLPKLSTILFTDPNLVPRPLPMMKFCLGCGAEGSFPGVFPYCSACVAQESADQEAEGRFAMDNGLIVDEEGWTYNSDREEE